MINLRWLIFDHIDPSHEIAKEQRKEIMRTAARSDIGAPRKWAPLVMAMIPGAVMAAVVMPWILWGKLNTIAGIPLLMAGQLMVTWIMFAVILRLFYRPRVLHAMHYLGYEVCVKCGYKRTGLVDDARCPECGADAPPPPHEEAAA